MQEKVSFSKLVCISTRRSIKLGYTPGVLTEATAELGISLLLAVSRRIVEATNSAKT